MFLRQLTLEDVRCFEDLTLDFDKSPVDDDINNNRKWTILLGNNGSGKSTVLRAAALITCGSDALPELLENPKNWIRQGQDECRISAILETQDGEERALSLDIRTDDSEEDVVERSKVSLKPLNDALHHTHRNYFVTAYGSTRRISGQEAYDHCNAQYKQRRSKAVATLFNRQALLNPLESWAVSLDHEQATKLVTIADALSRFLPGLRYSHLNGETQQLVFTTPDGDISLDQLSSGHQNMAAWVGDLLFRIYDTFEDYNEPLNTRGLLIIDEVDLHLHPTWQRSLHRFLETRLPNMQLLVTTHSPVTAQQAKEGQLHYLKREDNSVYLHRFSGDPSNLLVGQLLLSDAFGFDTDESQDMEDMKNRYRELRDQDDRSEAQTEELEHLKENIGVVLADRGGRAGQPDTQLERLKAIQAKILKETVDD